MPDLSMFAAVISTSGALLRAFGGVGLTYRANARQEEVQAERRRRESMAQERRQAYRDLMGTAAQLRTEIAIVRQRHWKDMDLRLASIQQHATTTGRHASHVALLAEDGVVEAALAVASAATGLAADVAKCVNLEWRGEQLLGGLIKDPVDFREFDSCVERFFRRVREAEG